MASIDRAWKLSSVDNKNISEMLSRSPKYYQERLEKLGFVGKGKKMLDAACGSAIFAIAASELGMEAYGIDSSAKYLAVGQTIQKNLKLENLKLEIGQLEKMPYKNNYFDFIICFDAWMYTDKVKSLAEMKRILKPGGKIYLGCVAGLGWYIDLIGKALIKGDRGLLLLALKAIGRRVHVYKRQAMNIIDNQNLKVIEFKSDKKVAGFYHTFDLIIEK